MEPGQKAPRTAWVRKSNPSAAMDEIEARGMGTLLGDARVRRIAAPAQRTARSRLAQPVEEATRSETARMADGRRWWP